MNARSVYFVENCPQPVWEAMNSDSNLSYLMEEILRGVEANIGRSDIPFTMEHLKTIVYQYVSHYDNKWLSIEFLNKEIIQFAIAEYTGRYFVAAKRAWFSADITRMLGGPGGILPTPEIKVKNRRPTPFQFHYTY